MQVEPQVTFDGIPVSDAVQQACWKEAEKLDRYYDRITSCRVVIAQPHTHHEQGNLFSVRVTLEVPGETLAVHREPSQHHKSEDVHVALREAFDAARRRLQDFVKHRAEHAR